MPGIFDRDYDEVMELFEQIDLQIQIDKQRLNSYNDSKIHENQRIRVRLI